MSVMQYHPLPRESSQKKLSEVAEYKSLAACMRRGCMQADTGCVHGRVLLKGNVAGKGAELADERTGISGWLFLLVQLYKKIRFTKKGPQVKFYSVLVLPAFYSTEPALSRRGNDSRTQLFDLRI